jgi:hypothetical protein
VQQQQRRQQQELQPSPASDIDNVCANMNMSAGVGALANKMFGRLRQTHSTSWSNVDLSAFAIQYCAATEFGDLRRADEIALFTGAHPQRVARLEDEHPLWQIPRAEASANGLHRLCYHLGIPRRHAAKVMGVLKELGHLEIVHISTLTAACVYLYHMVHLAKQQQQQQQRVTLSRVCDIAGVSKSAVGRCSTLLKKKYLHLFNNAA